MQSLEAAIEEADNLLHRSKKCIARVRNKNSKSGEESFSLFAKLSELKKEERLLRFKKQFKTENPSNTVLSNPGLIEKLVIKERLNTFVMCIHANDEGFTFAVKSWNDNDSVYENISEENYPALEDSILDYIDNCQIPPMLSDLLEQIDPPLYYGGCIIAEIWDCRDENLEEYKPYHVLLKPTIQTIVNDVNIISDKDETRRWSVEDKLALESMLLLANNAPLCLSPNSSISVAMQRLDSSKSALNHARLKHIARKYTARETHRKRCLMTYAKLPSPLKYLHAFISKKQEEEEEEEEAEEEAEIVEGEEISSQQQTSIQEEKSIQEDAQILEEIPILGETPILEEDTSILEEITPILDQITPLLNDGTSIMQEMTSIPEERAPTLEEISAMLENTTPIQEERVPTLEEITAILEDTAPIQTERRPTIEEITAILEDTSSIQEEITPIQVESTSNIDHTMPSDVPNIVWRNTVTEIVNLSRIPNSLETVIDPVDSSLKLVEEYLLLSKDFKSYAAIKLSVYRRNCDGEYIGEISYHDELTTDLFSGMSPAAAAAWCVPKKSSTLDANDDYILREESLKPKTAVTRFPLGTRLFARKYLTQFIDILTEQGKHKIEIIVTTPGYPAQCVTITGLQSSNNKVVPVDDTQPLSPSMATCSWEELYENPTEIAKSNVDHVNKLLDEAKAILQYQITSRYKPTTSTATDTDNVEKPIQSANKINDKSHSQRRNERQSSRHYQQHTQQQKNIQHIQSQLVQQPPPQQQQQHIQLQQQQQHTHIQQSHIQQQQQHVQTQQPYMLTQLQLPYQQQQQQQNAFEHQQHTLEQQQLHKQEDQLQQVNAQLWKRRQLQTQNQQQDQLHLIPPVSNSQTENERQAIVKLKAQIQEHRQMQANNNNNRHNLKSGENFSTTGHHSHINGLVPSQSIPNFASIFKRTDVPSTSHQVMLTQQFSNVTNTSAVNPTSAEQFQTGNIIGNTVPKVNCVVNNTDSNKFNQSPSSSSSNSAILSLLSDAHCSSSSSASANITLNSLLTTTVPSNAGRISSQNNHQSLPPSNATNNNNNSRQRIVAKRVRTPKTVSSANSNNSRRRSTSGSSNSAVGGTNAATGLSNIYDNNNDIIGNSRILESIIDDLKIDYPTIMPTDSITTNNNITSQPFMNVSIGSFVRQLDQHLASNQRLQNFSAIANVGDNVIAAGDNSGDVMKKTGVTTAPVSFSVIDNSVRSNSLLNDNIIVGRSNNNIGDFQTTIVDNRNRTNDKISRTSGVVDNSNSIASSSPLGINNNNNNSDNNIIIPNNIDNSSNGRVSFNNNHRLYNSNGNNSMLQTLSPVIGTSNIIGNHNNNNNNNNVFQQINSNDLRTMINALTSNVPQTLTADGGLADCNVPTITSAGVSGSNNAANVLQQSTNDGIAQLNVNCNNTNPTRLLSNSQNLSSSQPTRSSYFADLLFADDTDIIKDGENDETISTTVESRENMTTSTTLNNNNRITTTRQKLNSTIVSLAEIAQVASAFKRDQGTTGNISALPNSIGTPVILTTASRGERPVAGNIKSGSQKGISNTANANHTTQLLTSSGHHRTRPSQSPKQSAIQSLLTNPAKVTVPPNAVVQPCPPVQHSTLTLAAQQQIHYMLQKQALQQMHLNNSLNTAAGGAVASDNSSTSQVTSRNHVTSSLKMATKRRRLPTIGDN